MTAVAEFSGPFIFGVAVANTIGNEIVSSNHLNLLVIIAALASAIIWNIVTWLMGIPSSSSHALIGGIIGAVAIGAGLQEIQMAGVYKVLLTLFVFSDHWFSCGVDHCQYCLYALLESHAKCQWRVQEAPGGYLAWFGMGHGTNDSQKTMGVITLGLVISGVRKIFECSFLGHCDLRLGYRIGSFSGWMEIDSHSGFQVL